MKKLTFVTGKGGVGKTTLSLALALRAASQGRKVLLAEINSEEQVAQLLGRPPIGYQEVSLLPGLTGMNIQSKKAFEEYVLLQLKSKLLYRAVFENRLVRHFLEATPGLSDLMMIGKIYSLLDRFDHVIVDAPATGHGIGLLQISSIVAHAVRVGPLRTHAATIDAVLHNPKLTAILVVTLPEELPVTEALEMKQKLETLELPVAGMILNQSESPPLTERERREWEKFVRQQDPASQAMAIQLARADRANLYRKQLKASLQELPLQELPFLYSASFGLTEVQTLASLL